MSREIERKEGPTTSYDFPSLALWQDVLQHLREELRQSSLPGNKHINHPPLWIFIQWGPSAGTSY